MKITCIRHALQDHTCRCCLLILLCVCVNGGKIKCMEGQGAAHDAKIRI